MNLKSEPELPWRCEPQQRPCVCYLPNAKLQTNSSQLVGEHLADERGRYYPQELVETRTGQKREARNKTQNES